MELDDLKKTGEAPEWMDERGYLTLKRGSYFYGDETPKGMWRRCAKSAAKYANRPDLEDLFFKITWKGWFGLATPVASNLGLDRGLPISCFVTNTEDSINGEGGIFDTSYEIAAMSKAGGGVGVGFNSIRGRGEKIGTGGLSNGVIPWMRVHDMTVETVAQGGRRGSGSANLDIEHPDWDDFIETRDNTGDPQLRVNNLHLCTTISDSFMYKVKDGDLEARRKWEKLLKTRWETGESYLLFLDNCSKTLPAYYTDNNYSPERTNICCLTGDTLVNTVTGPQKIKDLVGKNTVIFDGVSWVRNSEFRSFGESEVTRITLKDGTYIDATENHRWFVSKNYEEIRKNKLVEKLTSDLKVGDYLEYHSEESHGEVCLNGAYFIGFFIGDGTFTRNRTPKLNVHFPKFVCKESLLSSLLEIPLNTELHHSVISEPSFSEVKMLESKDAWGRQEFSSVRGVAARKDYIKQVVTNKEGLSESWRSWSKETKLKFLSGLFDADGTVGSSLQFSAKNEKLLRQVKDILNSLGYSAGVDQTSTCYRLTMSSTDSYNFLNQAYCERLTWSNPIPNRKLTGWRKVVKIETLKDRQEVFCTTVPTTGKFALTCGILTGNSEILQYEDSKHSTVCCLSSWNLSHWEDFKDFSFSNGMTAFEVGHRYLDAVMSEFIDKGSKKRGLEKAVRSATKQRAIGIGVLGWHELLHKKELPFDTSWEVMQLNAEVFRTLRKEADRVSRLLAVEYGEPEWCKGTGERNIFKLALAPTRSNATILGTEFQSIQPGVANYFTDKSAKGDFVIKNKYLETVLDKYGKNDWTTWKSIMRKKGSVQHLDFLSEDEKKRFKTAREIDQRVLVRQAAQRQQFIDQGQSLNLFFPQNADEKYVHDVHWLAWELGIKTLYYLKTGAAIEGDVLDECESCEG